MNSLKGIFPEPKKEQKKNFIRENMKRLKLIQDKGHEAPAFASSGAPARLSAAAGASISAVKSSPSTKSGKITLNVAKTSSTNSRKKAGKSPEIRIKKGDMAEFLRRKKLRQTQVCDKSSDDEARSTQSSGRLRDIACQTVESNLAQKLEESTKLTMLYPRKEDDVDSKLKASGDSGRHRPGEANLYQSPKRSGDESQDFERPRSRLNAILERKDTHKDPYLPSGYQKGVVPKYLRERKDQGPKEADEARADEDQAVCPPGHVTLPDNERKETLRMLRNSFAELVSELNKMPVKTDTLRMRNRKMELEKQLAKLEEGIKVFSRPKVFVKIGE